MPKKNKRGKNKPIKPGNEPTRQNTEQDGGRPGMESTEENTISGDHIAGNSGTPT